MAAVVDGPTTQAPYTQPPLVLTDDLVAGRVTFEIDAGVITAAEIEAANLAPVGPNIRPPFSLNDFRWRMVLHVNAVLLVRLAAPGVTRVEVGQRERP